MKLNRLKPGVVGVGGAGGDAELDLTEGEASVVLLSGHVESVGAIPRPPRPLTVGRRASDRWLLRLGLGSLIAMSALTVWTTYKLEQFGAQLSDTCQTEARP